MTRSKGNSLQLLQRLITVVLVKRARRIQVATSALHEEFKRRIRDVQTPRQFAEDLAPLATNGEWKAFTFQAAVVHGLLCVLQTADAVRDNDA